MWQNFLYLNQIISASKRDRQRAVAPQEDSARLSEIWSTFSKLLCEMDI